MMNPRKNPGFTLLETVLYLALFAIVMGGSLAVAYQLSVSSGQIKQKIVVVQEGNFILQKIDWALSGVCAIDLPLPDASGPQLTVRKTQNTQTTVSTIDISPAGNTVELSRNGGSGVPLTSSWVSVANLRFDHTTAPGQPDGVTASFDMNGQSFFATKYLRKQTPCP